jgi:hypothetical protein
MLYWLMSRDIGVYLVAQMIRMKTASSFSSKVPGFAFMCPTSKVRTDELCMALYYWRSR